MTIARTADGARLRVAGEDGDAEQVAAVPPAARLLVRDGDRVAAGAPLTDGPLDPNELLAAVGAARTARFLVDEVQAVYRAQGVAIHDTHVEVIVRQMLRGVRVDGGGRHRPAAGRGGRPGRLRRRGRAGAGPGRRAGRRGSRAAGRDARRRTRRRLPGGGRRPRAGAGAGARRRWRGRPTRCATSPPASCSAGGCRPAPRWGGAPAGAGVAAGPGRRRAAARAATTGSWPPPPPGGTPARREIDARSLATLLAGLHAPLEPAPAG